MKRAPAARDVPLARLLAMAFRSIIDELHRRLEERGVTSLRPAYGFVLVRVRDEPSTTAQDIAELMGTSKQASAKLLASMEELGLVKRLPHPSDGRASRIVLTHSGVDSLDAVEAIYRDIEAEWAQAIGRERMANVRSSLEQALRTMHGGELPALRPVW